MYLTAQYLRSKKVKTPDWELKNLVKIYDGIHLVNKSFSSRLKSIKIEDAMANALVGLDCFASYIKFSIDENTLVEIEPAFRAFFEEG
ncbi:MAG: hypothetical protein A2233_03410 [Candidatus Kerfeldbacteria bacterium RIFOXYA2_FULL_38_24]|nr:MAG: hypothetical protein A2272_01440 [Candidatus Peregrinibacteria bacterium RIFOXYA12_FULL_33_12]OGY86454.1 MAG: hypothetical protein A2233_03410 [Candidatus Kerfeldbacteria bacterium RIFOXYA2_FULL_38_24]